MTTPTQDPARDETLFEGVTRSQIVAEDSPKLDALLAARDALIQAQSGSVTTTRQADLIQSMCADIIARATITRDDATADFIRLRVEEEKAAGIPSADRGKGAAVEAARAARVPDNEAAAHAERCKIMKDHMPHLHEAMSKGGLGTPDGHHKLLKVTRDLDPDQHEILDEMLADLYGTMTDQKLIDEARARIPKINPEKAEQKAKNAHKNRNIRFKKGGDGMAYIVWHLPAWKSNAIREIIVKRRKQIVASGNTAHPDDPLGEPRTEAQIESDIADELIMTGAFGIPVPDSDDQQDALSEAPDAEDPADPTDPAEPQAPETITPHTGKLPPAVTAQHPPLLIEVIMNSDTLLGIGNEPAQFADGSVLPAGAAREWIANYPGLVFLQRFFTTPTDKELLSMESKGRIFDRGTRRAVVLRDKKCANPHCNNEAEVIDHITKHSKGGPSSYANARGLCRYCNQRIENRGWITIDNGDGTITEILANGRQYTYRQKRFLEKPPDRPGQDPPPHPAEPDTDIEIEIDIAQLWDDTGTDPDSDHDPMADWAAGQDPDPPF